ncbi:MAG: glutathione S-transferase family protein [Motiliproteus sp.]
MLAQPDPDNPGLIKLWHCHSARSLRPLWALEEMGLAYQLEVLAFPPRVFHKEYFEVNVLGTVPFFDDGEAQMTESVAICQYLVARYQQYPLGLEVEHPEYADYLNWLSQSDATLTFPLAVALRYSLVEPQERRLPQASEDYARWFLARLRRLDRHIQAREFLVAERFTIADIAIGYALHFGSILGLDVHYTPQVKAYLERLRARPGFQRADRQGADQNPFKGIRLQLLDQP